MNKKAEKGDFTRAKKKPPDFATFRTEIDNKVLVLNTILYSIETRLNKRTIPLSSIREQYLFHHGTTHSLLLPAIYFFTIPPNKNLHILIKLSNGSYLYHPFTIPPNKNFHILIKLSNGSCLYNTYHPIIDYLSCPVCFIILLPSPTRS